MTVDPLVRWIASLLDMDRLGLVTVNVRPGVLTVEVAGGGADVILPDSEQKTIEVAYEECIYALAASAEERP